MPLHRRTSQNAACLWLPKISGARGERAWTNKSTAESVTQIKDDKKVAVLVCVCVVCVHPIENIRADLLKELITGGYMVYI